MEKVTKVEGGVYGGEVTALERIKLVVCHFKAGVPEYLYALLPCLSWLPKYNRRWLVGDLVAGLTVGLMVVPQSLAYANLANLPIAYGLYSSCLGTCLYALLGTCREVAVGPTAVVSLLFGAAITNLNRVFPNIPITQLATSFNLVVGLVTAAMGLLRLGVLFDAIPTPVLKGFTTGIAWVVISTQAAPLLGVQNVTANRNSIELLYGLFANLPDLNIFDMAFGMCSLGVIVGLNALANRLKTIPTFRGLRIVSNAIAVAVFTGVAFLLREEDVPLKLVRDVPRGFGGVGVPALTVGMFRSILAEMAPVVLIGLLEHVSIAKAFARKGGYRVSSSQEMVALGLGNAASSFVGGYTATGSFSRTAVNAQSGVCTPLSGLWVGAVVALALWALTPAFYYIPSATLSAIIISSALSLVSGPQTVVDLWRVQPTDCILFLVASLATFLGGAELGIGASVGLAFAFLLYRVARPQLYRLDRVDGCNAFVDVAHPHHAMGLPLPGVILFRPQGSLLFPNIDFIRDRVLDCVLEATSTASYASPWAVIFDLGAVNLIDSSGLQGLADLRNLLARYAQPGGVSRLDQPAFEMHFVAAHPNVHKILGRSTLASDLGTPLPTLTELSHQPPTPRFIFKRVYIGTCLYALPLPSPHYPGCDRYPPN
ncbi:Sulfate permease 2 [Massospora cicadina]|nr:Sulfate permease 2 [Massospora cicadina]